MGVHKILFCFASTPSGAVLTVRMAYSSSCCQHTQVWNMHTVRSTHKTGLELSPVRSRDLQTQLNTTDMITIAFIILSSTNKSLIAAAALAVTSDFTIFSLHKHDSWKLKWSRDWWGTFAVMLHSTKRRTVFEVFWLLPNKK